MITNDFRSANMFDMENQKIHGKKFVNQVRCEDLGTVNGTQLRLFFQNLENLSGRTHELCGASLRDRGEQG